MKIETKFQIGDRIYHILPESPMGVIIDITYRAATDTVYYEVQFNPEESSVTCMGHELSKDKTFI